MIYYKCLIFILFFLLIKSDPCDEENEQPYAVSDCFNRLSEEKKESEYKVYCCYSKSDISVPSCEALTKEQYDNIGDYIKFKKLIWGEVNYSIDCNSINLTVGLFNILLFFIYFMIFN